ncbi:MAG: copper ion binding protein [Synergistaceae bacterium]|jgi:copper chaperone|nr:copper ion binding protein [Synergistaceae bacterium]
MVHKVFNVAGMSCEHCVKAVTGAAQKAGASSVSVDLAKGTAAVDFDPTATSEAAIREAIEDQGYEVN